MIINSQYWSDMVIKERISNNLAKHSVEVKPIVYAMWATDNMTLYVH